MKIKNLSILLIAICIFALSLFVPLTLIDTAEGFYCDTIYTDTSGNTTETKLEFNYDSFTYTDVHLNLYMPTYGNVDKSNSCACVAGLNILGYYDVTLTELIPNFEPGLEYEGTYYFHGNSNTTVALEAELYDLMGTNTIAPGTSVSQFKKGMSSYVNNKGYNISYNSCGKKFNISTATNYLNQQVPIVLFLNSYEYYPENLVHITTSKLTMSGKKSNNGHVVAVFGYRKYNFYKNNELLRSDNFLLVSFGDDTMGYLNINNLSCIDESYAMNIF